MQFLDEHEDLFSHLCNGNRIFPHEKLMSSDMLNVQWNWIAVELWNSSLRRKCVSLSRCRHGNRLGVMTRLRSNFCTSCSSCCAGPAYIRRPKCRVYGDFVPEGSSLCVHSLDLLSLRQKWGPVGSHSWLFEVLQFCRKKWWPTGPVNATLTCFE